MIALGGQGPTLHSMAAEIPDARERLAYVARMTEQAADKVPNPVDEARPLCEEVALYERQGPGRHLGALGGF